MSPAAGGVAPAQSAAAAAAAVSPAIAGPEPDRPAARRDLQGPAEGADPANAAARKTVWGVPAPSPAAAANPVIAGDSSWPALVESKRGTSKSGSSDSLKSLSDGLGPSAQEDLIAASVPPHTVLGTNPISTGSNPTDMLGPNAVTAASSQQNGSTTQLNQARRSFNYGGYNGGSGSGGSRRGASSSGGGGSSGSGGDDNSNARSLGSGSSCNSSNGDGSTNFNDNVPGCGSSGNGNDRSRNALGNNNWNSNLRGVGSRSNNSGNGDGNYRNSGESSNHWSNNSRNSNGTTNGGGGRGYRGRRDHERGGNFSPRNYPRVSGMPYHHQQHPGVYQPGPFQRPPPPPAAHFMVQQPFMQYSPPFAYHGDVQPYPFYLPPVEQFHNMHLVRPPMQPVWFPQNQPDLQDDIRTQMEFYFSTNNLCHDTYLRRHMNDQGWVPIDFILTFNRMRAFTGLVDTNYILDAVRGSENLEVQGNNVRRRNDWADWLMH